MANLPASRAVLRGRRPRHPLERALLAVTALHLCFVTWALGAMHAWSQLTSFCLALAAACLALVPRHAPAESEGEAPVLRWPARQLLRLPLFWLGLAVLGFAAIQALNPAWRLESKNGDWWLTPVNAVGFLPQGVQVPFDRPGPWHGLVVAASAWLTACAVWIGFEHRRSYRLLAGLLVANAAALAVFGAIERATGTPAVFWSYVPTNDGFFAAFVYPNHAGAYFNLMTALAAGLAAHFAGRPGRASSSAFACLAAAAVTALAVVGSFSRGAIGLLGVFLALFMVAVAWRERGRRAVIPLVLGVAALVAIGFTAAHTDRLRERLAALAQHPVASTQDRALARAAAGDMLRDTWPGAWGFGAFRYGFPAYVAKYPEISGASHGTRWFWEHAHNDFLEYAIELGPLGLLPLVALGCWLTARFVKFRAWRHPVRLALGLGVALTLVHAGFDFVFQNPAILLTWTVLLVATVRWAELDAAG